MSAARLRDWCSSPPEPYMRVYSTRVRITSIILTAEREELPQIDTFLRTPRANEDGRLPYRWLGLPHKIGVSLS